MKITSNLDSALRHMRDPSRYRKIWADAICINQKDDYQKSQQVLQKAEVYRTAQVTIIYLGEGSFNADHFFNFREIPEQDARDCRESGEYCTMGEFVKSTVV